MTDNRSKTDTKRPGSDVTGVLDLEGSEQHHDLKNQPGAHGDPDHTDLNQGGGEAAKATITDALAEAEGDTQITSALKKAVNG